MRSLWALRFWLVIILLIAELFYGGWWLLRRAANLSVFKPHLAGYLRPPERRSLAGQAPQGKMLPIDVARRAVDDLYFDLPLWMRAVSPEEVRVVVWLRWGYVQIGRSRRGNLHASIAQVTVIDVANNALVGETSIRGPDPRGRNGLGEKPVKQIVAYLYSLQARPVPPGPSQP
jgi:hypothetical protein